MKTVLLALLCITCLAPCFALDLEGGPVIALWPNSAADIGLAVSVHAFDWPSDWALVGGYKQFLDLLYVDGKAAGGVSISLSKASSDNGVRLGTTAWKNDAVDRRWDFSVYARYGVPLNLFGSK